MDNNNFFQKQISAKTGLIILVILAAIVLVGVLACKYTALTFPGLPSIFRPKIPETINPTVPALQNIKKFASEEEFKAYLEKAETGYLTGFGGIRAMGLGMAETLMAPMAKEIGGGGMPERVSETTVQVAGIDEPDIVKTDGKEIYFSSSPVFRILRRGVALPETEAIMPPSYPEAKTKVVKAFPPADLVKESEIDKAGELLLAGKTLVIFSGQEIYGYNVSEPKSPSKKWAVELENNASIVASRLYQNKIYLVAKQNINPIRPCPIRPLGASGTSLEIKCIDIYHPVQPVAVDVTFTAMVLDPDSGKIEKNISFVGSSGASVVSMSKNAIYITYPYYESIIKFFSNFLKEKGRDLVNDALIQKIDKLENYDISEASKLTEFQILWDKYFSYLSDDEQLKIQNEITNRMSDYYKIHKRDLEKTGIVKIGIAEFELSSSGSVPGSPLNQFSLDEYDNHLRIATTIGEGWRGFGWIAGARERESANDVYVLDRNLKIMGSAKDLGLTERIYSARFIEDKGYIVTFRQTDPFYVLDLSNPEKPVLKGELKIPGFSSYLHPLAKNKILGIGKESWQVKISLFDVSSAENPKEIAKYILDEGWSEVLATHHAFLQDPKYEVFFLPGGKGGYIFSYKNEKLALLRAVSGFSIKRALYLNDYLYIIGDEKIIVLNEADWKEVKELKF
jgi:uncharacterized secreted protein with C-terminal beta-propeller domain